MDKMKLKRFLTEDQGVIATEYAVFVAAVGIILAVWVVALFKTMSRSLNAWANHFAIEATSTVIMIAVVGILLTAGLAAWYGNINSFFTGAGTKMSAEAGKMTLP
jgi:Flp pilus assembly pilin Flp